MFANGRVQGINRIPSARVNAWIKRHPVAALCILAYGLTWLGLIPQIMAGRGQSLPIPPTLAVAFAVGGCMFAALIVVHIADGGKAGRWRLLRRYTALAREFALVSPRPGRARARVSGGHRTGRAPARRATGASDP